MHREARAGGKRRNRESNDRRDGSRAGWLRIRLGGHGIPGQTAIQWPCIAAVAIGGCGSVADLFRAGVLIACSLPAGSRLQSHRETYGASLASAFQGGRRGGNQASRSIVHPRWCAVSAKRRPIRGNSTHPPAPSRLALLLSISIYLSSVALRLLLFNQPFH